MKEGGNFSLFFLTKGCHIMKKTFGVIGANYGDEGKGRCVDALVRDISSFDTVVVRSNGGAQAGHTVVLESGNRHVFHHFASGTFAGASTHLSQFFVHHPIVFFEEKALLDDLGFAPEVTADPRGFVTTPWDMMINQAAEMTRGDNRHGSCGYGFGETVGRNEETSFRLSFGDLFRDNLSEILLSIKNEWLPFRLNQLGIEPSVQLKSAMSDMRIFEVFLAQCMALRDEISIADDKSLSSHDFVIFEGAQGLMLDQEAKDFPHVTRSFTGVRNMAEIAREAGIDEIDVFYATRAYLTRHGSGPMPDERSLEGMFNVIDDTNIPNPWQLALRFGLLDIDLLSENISKDIVKSGDVKIRNHIFVSCLDQALEGVNFIDNGKVRKAGTSRFLDLVQQRTNSASVSASFGPTAHDQSFHIFDALAA